MDWNSSPASAKSHPPPPSDKAESFNDRLSHSEMDLGGGDELSFGGSGRNSSTPSAAHSWTDEHQIYYNDHHMMDFDYRGEEGLPHGEFELESDGRSMMSDDEERGFGPAPLEDVTRTFHPLINGTVFFFHWEQVLT